MKATEKMIDAACEASPNIQRADATRIVQAALDAEESEPRVSPFWTSVFGAMALSGMITVAFLLASLGTSGTWLDPRVWSGSYVPGDTLASSMDNGAWVIDAATNSAPWVFFGLWGFMVALSLIVTKFKKT